MRETIKRLGAKVLDVIYPRVCPVCRDVVTPKGELICPDCREKLSYVTEPMCMCCGRPIVSEQEEFCNGCGQRKFSYARGFAVLAYDDVMQQAIADFKYRNRKQTAEFFAAEMAAAFRRKMCGLGIAAFVPVPIHSARKRYRGYNQAEVLCRMLAGETGIPMQELLVRNKKTTPQKELNALDRLRNLETAISLNPMLQENKIPETVALVDDIYTTGSTAEACTRVLLRAGVDKVYLFNLCIVTEREKHDKGKGW